MSEPGVPTAGEALSRLFDWLMDEFWVDGGNDIDGGSLQDKLVELGLIHPVPFDPKIHDGSLCGCAPGDDFYVLTKLGEKARSLPHPAAGEDGR